MMIMQRRRIVAITLAVLLPVLLGAGKCSNSAPPPSPPSNHHVAQQPTGGAMPNPDPKPSKPGDTAWYIYFTLTWNATQSPCMLAAWNIGQGQQKNKRCGHGVNWTTEWSAGAAVYRGQQVAVVVLPEYAGAPSNATVIARQHAAGQGPARTICTGTNVDNGGQGAAQCSGLVV